MGRDRNIRVLNLSYWSRKMVQPTSADSPDAEREAIQAFCNSGGIVVIAAGNGDPDALGLGVNVIRDGTRLYPAALAEDLAGELVTGPCVIVQTACKACIMSILAEGWVPFRYRVMLLTPRVSNIANIGPMYTAALTARDYLGQGLELATGTMHGLDSTLKGGPVDVASSVLLHAVFLRVHSQ